MSSTSSPSPRSLRARWVFPVAGPPLRAAAVTISQGRIVAVGSPPHGVPIEDLDHAAIVPGLVNAHTHLEFSDLASPIGRAGMGLVEWLGEVIQHRDNSRRVWSTGTIAQRWSAQTHEHLLENGGSALH